MPRNVRDTMWALPAIDLILLFRLGVHVALYRAGFLAFTADDFGRAVVAAKWSQAPTPQWHGVWLPFYAYMFGTALRLKWELLWVPRLLAILGGVTSIVFMYLLASSLFKSRIVGLISAFFLSVK